MTYRIARNGGQFTVTDKSGEEVGAYYTKQEARRSVQLFKQDDAMSKTARRLVAVATQTLMRTYGIDRRAARSWIKEAAD